ncbi:isopentenyltransferase 9, ARABIDOPSIS THALIANA ISOPENTENYLTRANSFERASE 9 [Hibiscus trionum]|uniref:tRNA dimethylallyltransferase n=1 Tax=Hibiscus trionum TaxID=183268 RepID=A0A9W7GQP6_HIBTR|nr:isopentenyltransferase 9, ARABIDOPSIS THALIANA ISOPENTENYLTRANSFERASE 9 [Hibiscus trionum]
MIPSGIYILRSIRLPKKPIFPLLCNCRKTFVTSSSSVSVNRKKEKVIVISGPTGAGKTRLALELAKRLNGEIIGADSVQVYRGLDVGSAKPSPTDRKEVPHHLIDILHPSEDYSVGQIFEDARQATKDILHSGRVPIVTGGTGLYLRWYIYGKPDVPKASREVAAKVCSELGYFERQGDWDAAVQLVVDAGDPKAESLAANDWYRLRRSLEIIRSSGSPPSAFQVPYDSFKHQNDQSETIDTCDLKSSTGGLEQAKVKDLDYDFICFFLTNRRLDLYRLIDLRCEHMLSDGILSEARWLLDTGLLPNSNSATRAIGYRQAMEYLLHCREQGGVSSTRDFYYFLSEFQKVSRNFAKRQLTWFRNEHIYHWLNASKPLDKVLNFIYDAYNDQSGTLCVPESLQMKKDTSSKREASDLKAYRAKNRHFVHREDCSDILDWIRRTQGEKSCADSSN